jgi:hypothetical protein
MLENEEEKKEGTDEKEHFPFQIDSTTGSLTTRRELDRERVAEYRFLVCEIYFSF